jgi:hypothetical protein
MPSNVLTPFISSLCTFSTCLSRTSCRYKDLGQSAQRWNFIKRWIEVGIFLVLHISLYSICWDWVDFCSHTYLLWFTISHKEFFPCNRNGISTGERSFFWGLKYFFFLLCYFSFVFLAVSLLGRSCSLWVWVFSLLPLPSLVLKHIHPFFLDSRVYTLAVSLQEAYICSVFLNNHVYQFPSLVLLV